MYLVNGKDFEGMALAEICGRVSLGSLCRPVLSRKAMELKERLEGKE